MIKVAPKQTLAEFALTAGRGLVGSSAGVAAEVNPWWSPIAFIQPTSAYPPEDETTTYLWPSYAFETGNANPDETIWALVRVPPSYSGSLSLTVKAWGVANDATSKTAALSAQAKDWAPDNNEAAPTTNGSPATGNWTSSASVANAVITASLAYTLASALVVDGFLVVELTVDASASTLNGTDWRLVDLAVREA